MRGTELQVELAKAGEFEGVEELGAELDPIALVE